jgi:hypothetical protein
MHRLIKALCIINLLAALIVWLPLLAEIQPDHLFAVLFRGISIIFILYALQGVLGLMDNLKWWDLVSVGIISLVTLYFVIIGAEITFLWLASPVGIYFALQAIRNKIPDNIKILYLNIWNILSVSMYLLDRYTSLF